MNTKTKNKYFGLLFLLASIIYCLDASSSETISDPDPLHAYHGFQISAPHPITTNHFPIVYFTENKLPIFGKEFNYYDTRERQHQTIPEILPAEQDPDGNWGSPVNDFQLSLRFRERQYLKDDSVPAVIILRNLRFTNSPCWWRNALPDHGYKIVVHYGQKFTEWVRPQRPPPKVISFDDLPSTDPYKFGMMAHGQGLTVVDLNQFFNLTRVGKYSVQVQIQVPTADGKGTTNVISGIAKFEVVNELSN